MSVEFPGADLSFTTYYLPSGAEPRGRKTVGLIPNHARRGNVKVWLRSQLKKKEGRIYHSIFKLKFRSQNYCTSKLENNEPVQFACSQRLSSFSAAGDLRNSLQHFILLIDGSVFKKSKHIPEDLKYKQHR